MYKIIAVDLDETLFNSAGTVDEGNKVAIAKARELGVKIVVSSGRGPGVLGNVYHELNIDKDDEYSILCNGAIVIENKSGRLICCHLINYEKTIELFNFGISKNLCVQVYTMDNVYVYQYLDDEYQRIKHFGKTIKFMDNLDTDIFKGQQIIKVLFQKTADVAYLQTLEDKLKPITDKHITISYSSHRYMEFNAFGIHKGVGLIELAKFLDVDISETIGVGDNYNDLGLIKDAGLGVAVANAIEPIKKIADVVTKADHNENAIAEVIDAYVLNENKN